jgi:lysophospholipase L1-like esterase
VSTPPRWNALPRFLVLALSSATALAAVELGLRARGPAPAFRVWTPGLEATLEPRPEILGGVSGPTRFRVSSLGFRADERPADAELSILALGGSATECLYLDQDEAWPALLQEDLETRLRRRVWIANAGRSGRTTRDHALQARHLLAQPPRFERILVLTGVNDLCAWLALGQVPAGPAELARAFDVLPRDEVPGPWWRRTAVFELARELRSRLGDAHLAQDPDGGIYTTWRAHRRSAGAWLDELPDPHAALAGYRAGLSDLLASCAGHGSELVLVTQPAMWTADLAPEREALLWMGGVGEYQESPGCAYYTAGALARGLALFNAALEAFAREHDLALLDLARALAGDPGCFYDDVHFNEEGARRVARFLAEALAGLESD